MRKFQLRFMAEHMGMRLAIRQFAREQVEILDLAHAEGRFDEPVLGPLGSAVKSGAKWTDKYPVWQKYAAELERLLEFTQRNGSFEAYRNVLQSSEDRRNSALMELRVGLHLEQSGFRLVQWSPKGGGRAEGEFLVEGPSRERMFVEVKSPSWKGEVFGWNGKARSASQLERVKRPKHLNREVGAVAPWQGLRFALDKAYKEQTKFKDGTPNLLVVADDMRVSLAHLVEVQAFQALYSTNRSDPGYFTDKRFELLGGVGIFWIDQEVGKPTVGYHMRLFLNQNSLPATELPHDLREKFCAGTVAG